MKKFYVASALSNVQRAQQLISDLEKLGWACSYNWTKQWEKEVAAEANGSSGSVEEKREIAHKELLGVLEADVLILFLPGGRGAHVELGAALVASVPVLLLYNTEEQLRGTFPYECIFYLDEGVTPYQFQGPQPKESEVIGLMNALMDRAHSTVDDWLEKTAVRSRE